MLNCMSADHYFRYAMCNNSNISIIKSALHVFALFIIFTVVNNYLPAFTKLTVQGFNKITVKCRRFNGNRKKTSNPR